MMKVDQKELQQAVAKIEAWKKNPATTYTPKNILQDHADDLINICNFFPEMLQALQDVRMFMATNVPMTDGSPMHKAVKKLTARIEGVR